MSTNNVHAVILAGGSGSLLWSLPRQHLPKQFLALDGNTSLLQATIDRLSPTIDANRVLIVTQEAHAKDENGNVVLISKNDQTQRVRKVTAAPQQRGATEHIYHAKVNRPWGSLPFWKKTRRASSSSVLRLHPAPSLAYKTSHRSEYWVVVSGTGTVTVTNGDEVVTVHKNQST